MHVIREDPANPNLLFAGTEFGLYVSFNRGQHWEKMKNGLPTVPVFDLQIHPREHDLILATHGRSIWIMDNITALEEIASNENVLTTDLHLFTPLPGIEWKTANYRGFLGTRHFMAENPQAGLVLDYYAKAAGPVRVTVKDKAGNEVRQLSGRAAAGVVNRIAWDMRSDAPIRPAGGQTAGAGGGRGGAGGGGRGGGAAGAGGGRGATTAFEAPEAGGGGPGEPAAETAEGGGAAGGRGGGGGGGRGGFGGARGTLVDPGEYTVSLTLAGKTETKTVRVEDDPRVSVSDADRAKRRTTLTRLYTMTKQADDGRRKIVAMNVAVSSLIDGWKRPAAPTVPDAVKKAADESLAKIKAVLGTFESAGGGRGGGGGAGAPPPYTPPPVNQKISRLMGAIDNYSGPPTSRQLADIDECTAQLQKGLEEVAKLDGEVPKLNKLMQDAGIPYITVDPASVPAAQGGGRGGER